MRRLEAPVRSQGCERSGTKSLQGNRKDRQWYLSLQWELDAELASSIVNVEDDEPLADTLAIDVGCESCDVRT